MANIKQVSTINLRGFETVGAQLNSLVPLYDHSNRFLVSKHREIELRQKFLFMR